MRFIFAILFFLSSAVCWGQSKMDLDDLQIKGELHNDDRLRMLAREKNDLKNYVKYRTNYRAEMIEGLAKPEPRANYKVKY